MRELVENSLDSAEGIGELPEIAVTMCALLHFAHSCVCSCTKLRFHVPHIICVESTHTQSGC